MDHAATLRRVYDLLSAHDVDAFGETLADDFVEHETLPTGDPTRKGVMDLFRAYIGAFPDLAMTVEDIVDGGDKLAARVRLTGTHRGDLLGIPATGRSIDVQLIDVMRFADDGLIHEHWGVFDALTMMEQLGAAPG
jgi:steroid delta-isomerase-like uncharacterized protein